MPTQLRQVTTARLGASALILFALGLTLTDTSGLVPDRMIDLLGYYTLQANLIALAVWIALVIAAAWLSVAIPRAYAGGWVPYGYLDPARGLRSIVGTVGWHGLVLAILTVAALRVRAWRSVPHFQLAEADSEGLASLGLDRAVP